MTNLRILRVALLSLAILMMSACGEVSEPESGAAGAAGGTAAPARLSVVSATPSKVTGVEQTIDLVFSDPDGADKIAIVQLMISPTLSYPKSCWIEYALKLGTVRMMDGSGKGKAGQTGALTSSQCTIDMSRLKHAVDGNSLTVSVPVKLASGVENTQNIFAIASELSQHSGWKTVGTWIQQAPSAK